MSSDNDIAFSGGRTPDLPRLADDSAQPGWMVLDVARESRFTGEIVFDGEPEIHAYFDDGIAYHASRDGDPSLCQRLLDAKIVDAAQIDRGVVRVGNVEHLGRLFDRDPSVDRDAVMVLVELATDEVLTEIAARPMCDVTLTAYRHHVSGVHRWFVAPNDPVQLAPVGQVAQLDMSVTTDLPGLPVTERIDAQDEVHIEWDEPTVGAVAAAPAVREFEESRLQSVLDAPPSSQGSSTGSIMFEPPDADSFVSDAAPGEPAADDAEEPAMELLGLDDIVVSTPPVSDVETLDPVGFHEEFQIVWPDGTEQALPARRDRNGHAAVLLDDGSLPVVDAPADADVAADGMDDGERPAADSTDADSPVDDEPPAADSTDADSPVDDEPPDADGTPRADPLADRVSEAQPPVHVLGVDSPDRIERPRTPFEAPDRVTDPEAIADAVPDRDPDSASDQHDELVATGGGGDFRLNVPTLALDDDSTPSEHQPDDVVDAVRRALAAIEAATMTSAALPPIPDDMIEIDVHGDHVELAAIDGGAPVVEADGLFETAAAQQPVMSPFAAPTLETSAEAIYARQSGGAPDRSATRVASVVFVDDESDDNDTTERAGALRRLIGSLRRK